MEDNNKEVQENELLAIESILDKHQFRITGKSGYIKIYPHMTKETITIKPSDAASTSNHHEISFLPPMTLRFTLPPSYPTHSSPDFVLSCMWLNKDQINLLSNKLKDLWKSNSGSEILFEWYQCLQEETFSILDITNELILSTSADKNSKISAHTSQDVNSGENARPTAGQSETLMVLLVYNRMKEEEKFQTSVFCCNICFETKLGSNCSQFKVCDHVYCKDCLSSYFKVLITEGSVKALTCPEEGCNSQALPDQVQKLVSDDLYARYERLLLQTTLDTMSDIVYCPLSHCRAAVIVDPNENLAQCPACSYAFCVFCKLVYHGVIPCKISTGEIKKLCEEYKVASHERRAQMEKKYGAKALRNAIEDSESQQWLEKNAKPCPNCSAHIEKMDGCNKMTCFKCRTYFCWLCMRLLNPDNPYKHFSDSRYECFNRLFEGVAMDEEDFFFI